MVRGTQTLDLQREASRFVGRAGRERTRARTLEARKGTTYRIGEWGEGALGPEPEHFLLTIFKRHAGQNIRIVAFSGAPPEVFKIGFTLSCGPPHHYMHPQGYKYATETNAVNSLVDRTFQATNDLGLPLHDSEGFPVLQRRICDHSYNVPENAGSAINRYFNGRGGHTRKGEDWVFTYPVLQHDTVPVLCPGDIVKVYTAQSIVAQEAPIQFFAQGVSHCLIQPIINDLTSKLNALEKPSKQSLCNYKAAIARLGEYAEKYQAGIPVSALHTMVEDVSTTGKKLNLEIKVPCAKKGEDQFIRIENQYGHGNTYQFVNWRLNHVDMLAATYKDFKNPTEKTQDEMKDLLASLLEAGEFVEWSCNPDGPVSICTATHFYRCHVGFGNHMKEWGAQFDGFRIDHVKDNMMSKFILDGTHYCCLAVFNPDLPREHVRCYDIKKSYAMFHEARFYDECLFPGKLTDCRPTNCVMGPGLYRITDICWANADPKFTRLCELMGNPFLPDNVYALPLLKLLDFHNVTYRIVQGCWAGGAEDTFDFRFSDELLEKKQYPLVVGQWNHLKHEQTTNIRGTKQFAAHLAASSANCRVDWFEPSDAESWGPSDGTIRVSYPQEHVWHLSQFTAYINAYELIKMADQLMLVDLDKVIQLQKDDFICMDHEFELLPYMSDKTVEMGQVHSNGGTKLDNKVINVFEGDGRPCYLSGIWQNDGDDGPSDVFQSIDKAAQRHAERFAHIDASQIIPHSVIALDGPGGTGKTDFLLRDECLQRKCYLAQSHKLSRAKAVEYKLAFSEECDFDSITNEIKDIEKGKKQHLIVRHHNRLEVTVWARALHGSELIWGVIHRYANVLIIDEVSMMHNETVKFLMQRFKRHKIFLCGDPGFQLAAYSTNADSGTPKTPFDAAKLNIPTYTFTKIFRVKCDRLLAIRQEGRKLLERGITTLTWQEYRRRHAGVFFPPDWGMTKYNKVGPVAGLSFAEAERNEWYVQKVARPCDSKRGLMHTFRRYVDQKYHESQPITVEELEHFYKARFTTVSSFQEVADMYQAWECVDGEYLPKDMIIASTNAFADEWTEFLTPMQRNAKVATATRMQQGKLFKHFENAPTERAYIERKKNMAYARYLNAPVCVYKVELESGGRTPFLREHEVEKVISGGQPGHGDTVCVKSSGEIGRVVQVDQTQKEHAYKQFRHYDRLSNAMQPAPTVVTHVNEVQLQKWKIEATTRDYSRGEIVISAEPPTEKCHIAHAFTAHSTIGETARGKVFIDRRNLFEMEHWETIIGRAKRWEDVVIVDLPDPDPSEKYANTIIYSISSKKGQCQYIGFTTQTLEKRKQGHVNAYKAGKKECAASLVLEFKDWQMDVIEQFPCADRAEAEARENYHIQRADNCVNKSIRHGAALEPCAPKERVEDQHFYEEDNSYEEQLDDQLFYEEDNSYEEPGRMLVTASLSNTASVDESSDSARAAAEAMMELEDAPMAKVRQIQEEMREKRSLEGQDAPPPPVQRAKRPRGMMMSMDEMRAMRNTLG